MAEVYAGLDVSEELTHVCVTDVSGAIVWAGACATDPEVIARALRTRAPGLVRVILETGRLSAFLYPGLAERGAPVACVCARHAKGVLSPRVKGRRLALRATDTDGPFDICYRSHTLAQSDLRRSHQPVSHVPEQVSTLSPV